MVYKEFPGAGSVVFLQPSAKGAQRVGDAPRSTATGIQGDAKTNTLDDLGVFLVESWVDTNLAYFLVHHDENTLSSPTKSAQLFSVFSSQVLPIKVGFFGGQKWFVGG